MSTPRTLLTLIQQLLHPSKLLLEEHGDARAHAAVLADAVGQGVRGGAREQVPLDALDLQNTKRRVNTQNPRARAQRTLR